MSDRCGPFLIGETPARVRSDLTVEPLAGGAAFWERLGAGLLGDFRGELLIVGSDGDGDWPHWERHPHGDELVVLLAGTIELVLEEAAGLRRLPLTRPGSYVRVPRGLWHRGLNGRACRLLFITAGEGTEHRPAAAP